MEIKKFATAEETCAAVAQLLAEMTNEGGNIAISGGSTPKLLFGIIAERYRYADWSRLNFFWVDERLVPETDKESNYGEFYKTLVAQGVVPQTSVFPVGYHQDDVRSLAGYSLTVRDKVLFENELPRFDLIILGIGEDGHTASIFPDNLASFSSDNFVERTIHPQTKQHRITLTGSAINHAKQVIFLCTGENKKDILKKVIQEKDMSLPATCVSPISGSLTYYIGGLDV